MSGIIRFDIFGDILHCLLRGCVGRRGHRKLCGGIENSWFLPCVTIACRSNKQALCMTRRCGTYPARSTCVAPYSRICAALQYLMTLKLGLRCYVLRCRSSHLIVWLWILTCRPYRGIPYRPHSAPTLVDTVQHLLPGT